MPPIELRLWSLVMGATLFVNVRPGEHLYMDCNKKSNSHSGCKNEQQADLEVQLENKITIAGH